MDLSTAPFPADVLKPVEQETQPTNLAAAPVLVPIRSIGPSERDRIARHLLALDAHDRYLRFGYAASDEQIQHYVDALDFERDEVFGIFNRRLELIALAHLAFAPGGDYGGCAEFGVSVTKHARGRGYGARLFERAMVSARNAGVHMLFVHVLSENAAMLKIARNAGAIVARSGPEVEAHIELPGATPDTRMSALAQDGFGEIDFQLKTRAQQFWSFLAALQQIRSGVRASQGHSAS